MKLNSEEKDMSFTILLAVLFGALVGIGTASWCLGLAASIAMIVFVLKRG